MNPTTAEGRRYRIHHVLGQGGFGTVYAADLLGEGGFTRKVALKVLNPEMDGVEDVAHRLRDEARLLGILRHRAIVQVDGLVRLNDRWTVVMEFIEGVDLQKLVRSGGPVPLGCALEILSEVASALDVAYMTPGPNGVPLKLLHRDIKPPNILLTSAAETKVLDFGIARAEFTEREAKTKSVLFGSIGYMAPERMEFQELPAGDVFALGVVLFELLDGNPLGKTSVNPTKHNAHVQDAISKLLKKIGNHPPDFPELLRSMLAYDPDERPSAREVERRCRALRGAIGEPWLRDWAERVVPNLVKDRAPAPTDGLSGQIVMEGVSTRVAPPPPPGPPPPPPPMTEWSEGSAMPAVSSPVASKVPAPVRRKPPSGPGFWGMLVRLTVAMGCVTVLGLGVAVLFIGVGTAGAALLGFLAIIEAVNQLPDVPMPVDPAVAPYEAPADPSIPEVTPSGEEEYRGPFGFTATVTEPWKSMGFPLGRGACIYSDAKTFTAYHPPGSVDDKAAEYAAAFRRAGWEVGFDYKMDEMRSMTFTQGDRQTVVAVMLYDGELLVSVSQQ